MKVNGNECSIVMRTTNHEFYVPYAEETVREAVSFLAEETPIEGDGNFKAIQKKSGVTGCIVTPLTLKTVPYLFYIAFGTAEKPTFKSEIRNLYGSLLKLLLLEDSDRFNVIQDRKTERRIFINCRINGFEFRVEREQPVKLKLDLCGENTAAPFLYTDPIINEIGERFDSNYVDYWINGKENHFIYGLTILVKKDKGVKTEIWIRRNIEKENDVPEKIDELIISARLLNDKYEFRSYGLFRITLKKLVFISDETNVNSSDTVIGSLRHCVMGDVFASVFSSNGALL